MTKTNDDMYVNSTLSIQMNNVFNYVIRLDWPRKLESARIISSTLLKYENGRGPSR